MRAAHAPRMRRTYASKAPQMRHTCTPHALSHAPPDAPPQPRLLHTVVVGGEHAFVPCPKGLTRAVTHPLAPRAAKPR